MTNTQRIRNAAGGGLLVGINTMAMLSNLVVQGPGVALLFNGFGLLGGLAMMYAAFRKVAE